MKIGNALGFPEELHSYEPDPGLVLPTCRLGLEFEYERVGRGLPSEGWSSYFTMKRDGSLHDAGQEFVFRNPLFGKDAVMAIKSLCAYAQASRYAVSVRTGLHVHHDARDMSQEHLATESALYALYERAVYNFVGNNREENVFCLPWYQSHQAANRVRDILACKSADKLKTAASALAEEKYAGLNLDTLARFGSVEWRHSLVSVDANYVLDWVNIVLRFKEIAMRGISPDQLLERCAKAPRGELYSLFGPQAKLLDYPLLEEHVLETGVPTALDILVTEERGPPKRPSEMWKEPPPVTPNASYVAWSDGIMLEQKGAPAAKPRPKKKPPRPPIQRVRMSDTAMEAPTIPAPPGTSLTFDWFAAAGRNATGMTIIDDDQPITGEEF